MIIKKWLTADWHLGETRMDLMGRPFFGPDDQLELLVRNHNTVVRPKDKVIVIGDVCFQKSEDPKSWLDKCARFNGQKILIRGNHDRIFTDDDLKPYFDMVIGDGGGYYDTFGGIRCYLTHYPTEGVADAFNLVGHIHGAWKYQLNMFNVGVDVNHFRPVDADTIPFHFNAVSKFYDDDVWVAYNPINLNEHTANRGKSGTYFNPNAASPRKNIFVKND